MITVQTRDAMKDLRTMADKLSHAEVMKSQARAINHTLGIARTALNRVIRESYKIPLTQANKAMNLVRANASAPVGVIMASSFRTPLAAFQPSFTSSSGVRTVITKQGYAASRVNRVKRVNTTAMQIEIIRGKKTTVRSAFLIPGMGKAVVAGRGTYSASKEFTWRHKRVNKQGSDLPIDSLSTVSVFKAITQSKQQKQIADDLLPRYRDRLLHEMSRAIGNP